MNMDDPASDELPHGEYHATVTTESDDLMSLTTESRSGTSAIAAEGESKAARRRSVATRQQKVAVGGIVAIGALLGALSSGAPTGGPIDVVYRALFVGILSLAASRARRWSVIVASAIAACASLGFGLLVAGLALVMAVFLVGRDLRSRVYGAAIGALVGTALLRLEIDWFLGASALVGTGAAAVLLWSGYRVSGRRTRRAWRRAAIGVGVLGAVGVAMSLYQAVTFNSPLRAAVQSTVDGVGAVQDGDTVTGSAKFAEASKTFSDVADRSDALWLFPSRLVPIVSHNVDVVSTLSEAGATLTASAQRSAAEVDYDQIRREGGGVDLAMLDRFRDPVVQTAAELAGAEKLIDDLQSPWIVGLLADKVDEFNERVTDLREQTDLAATALQYGPALFGGEGERRYLVLLGNPSEARDLGGHIGNWAELTMNDGKISLVDVGLPMELSNPSMDAALDESQSLPPSFIAMRPGMYPQNWGASIDFTTDAKVAAALFSRKTGRAVDGVLYADPYALAAMLEITGPIPVPLLDLQISSANAVKFLTLDQFTAYADPNTGNDALTQLVRDIFERLTTSTLPGPSQLGALFGPLVKEGRFRMVSLKADDHTLLGEVGLDNGFQWTEGDDLFAVVSRNANPSKIDAFLHRTTTYDVQWDPESGSIEAVATIELRNDAPATGLPRYVIGNSAGLPWGTNITDVAVLSPFEATRAAIDGVDAPVTPLLDGTTWRHTVRVAIPPGTTSVITVHLEGEVDAGAIYRLRYGGQPLVQEGKTTINVTAADRTIAPGGGIETSESTATATLSDVGQTFVTLRAE